MRNFKFLKKKAVLVIICIALGVVFAYGETKYIRNTFKEAEYVKVLFAKEDIQINNNLNKDVYEFKEFPASLISPEMVTDENILKGKVSKRDIKKGTLIFRSDLSDIKVPIVNEGMVTVTFKTNLIDGLAGEIYPGNFVNIGFVDKDGIEAKLVFENVQVINITDNEGNKLQEDNEKKSNRFDVQKNIPAAVTVVLSPEEAILLKKYEVQGKLFLMGVNN